MAKINGWRTKKQIEQEKARRGQERLIRKDRKQRIRDGVANAKSVQELRAVVADIVEELGLSQ